MSESLRPELRSAIRPPRTGWRAWTYRGSRRRSSVRIGHLATGMVLFYAIYLR